MAFDEGHDAVEAEEGRAVGGKKHHCRRGNGPCRLPCAAPEVATGLKPQQALGGDAERAPGVDAETLVPDAPHSEGEGAEVDECEPSYRFGVDEERKGAYREIAQAHLAPAEDAEE